MPKRKRDSLANPIRLAPKDPEDDDVIQVVIETPKGSRNKYALDVKQKVFELTRCSRQGWCFRMTLDSFPPL
jgi:inorganic pyrophosphatase